MQRKLVRSLFAAARRLVPALLSFVVAVALVAGVARAGAAYFFCPWTDQLAAHPCCANGHEDDGGPTDRVDATRKECCEAGRLAALPRVTTATPLVPPSAPLVAVLPSLSDAPQCEALVSAPRNFIFREKGHWPTALERCARSRVFLL